MVKEIENLIRAGFPIIIHDTNITDRMFLFIESNQDILNQYLCLCQNYGTKTINRWIGRLLKTTYNLINSGRAIATSRLIKNYTLH